jgi:putative redox protein
VSRIVRINDSHVRYSQTIFAGPHLLRADEPVDVGGSDTGPNPYELLLAALGSCASITVRMYADRKQWPLESVHIELSYGGAHAEDAVACETETGMITGIEMEVSFAGDLSEQQRQRLLEIANKCPVHRTLTSRIQIRGTLAEIARAEIAAQESK